MSRTNIYHGIMPCVAQRLSPLLAKCHTFGQGRIAKCAIIAFVARGRRHCMVCKIYAVSFAATRTQLEIVTLVSERKIILRIKYTQRGADNNAAAIRSAIV